MILPATAEAIVRAAALIVGGEVVAFPTETVYGLGADATNASAVARVFAIKNRPSFDPLIVHVADARMLGEVAARWPPAAQALAEHCWPGPLTLVVPKTDRIPDIVTAGLASVGVRMPDHPVARRLITRAAVPIAAPSANPFGYVSPTTAEHVAAQLGTQVPLILDGGACRVGVESTIVSLLEPVPALLRPGGIALEDIQRIVGRVQIATDRPLLAPGQLPRHYAPRTPIELVDCVAEIPPALRPRAALIILGPTPQAAGFAHVEVLAADGTLTAAAANLFAALRRLDTAGCERIYAVRLPETGLGLAIMDRLRRASTRE